MPLPFHPKPGTIVVCDYSTGFREPEMVKRRLAVTISPKLKRRNDLVTVVPLSTTAPHAEEPWHHRLELTLPPPWGDGPRWAKCDMLATVGYARLNLPHTRHPVTGARRYVQIQVSDEDVLALLHATRCALGIGH
ncbi:type II toxin-antitoxin system PemK/MazF family toxin [Sphingomonas sp. NFR15]|uniref:type II toxin-antitoxin system PemK/MazF family toxin n=1 Tax=Sphingomonas sp. NFR15 TaxID=1566282 RepID=UPI000886F0AF|nr:type II toxin-antitoxin system PemK/MazF family toxin [Sphingomonas sp. NFR15]SDA34652.1 Uncharacterized protein YifN, PemK superfamily [Sphingomonas sp. NFR15]